MDKGSFNGEQVAVTSLFINLCLCSHQLNPARDKFDLGTYSTKQDWIETQIYKMLQANQANEN